MTTAFVSRLREALDAAASGVQPMQGMHSAVLHRAVAIRRRRAAAVAVTSAGGVTAVVVLVAGLLGYAAERATSEPASSGAPVATSTDARPCDGSPEEAQQRFDARHPVDPADTVTISGAPGSLVADVAGRRYPLPPEIATVSEAHPAGPGLVLLTRSDPPVLREGQIVFTLVIADERGRTRTLAEGLIGGVAVSPDESAAAFAVRSATKVAGSRTSAVRVVDLATGRQTSALGGIPDDTFSTWASGWGSEGVLVATGRESGYYLWKPPAPGVPQSVRAYSTPIVAAAPHARAVLVLEATDCLVDLAPATGRRSELDLIEGLVGRVSGPLQQVATASAVRGTVQDVLAAFYPPGQAYIGGQKIPLDHQLVVVQLTGHFDHRAPAGADSKATSQVAIYDATSQTWLPFAQYGGSWNLEKLGTPVRLTFPSASTTP